MQTLEIATKMGDFLASRVQGQKLHQRIEEFLTSGDQVTLDFDNVSLVMQPFLDASIGALIRSRGPELMKHLKFRNCNAESHALLHLVVELATSHYNENRS